MPLVRKLVVAVGLAGAVGLLAWLAPDVLSLWAERNLLLADKLWPRKIRLEVVGFKDGVAKVAAGRISISASAPFRGDTEIPILPEQGRNPLSRRSGRCVSQDMKTIGAAASLSAAKDQALQEYGYQFTGLLSTVHFDIVGGDARCGTCDQGRSQSLAEALARLQLPLLHGADPDDHRNRHRRRCRAGRLQADRQRHRQQAAGNLAHRLPRERAAHRLASSISGDQLGGDRNTFSYASIRSLIRRWPSRPREGVRRTAPRHDEAGRAAARDYTLQFTLRDADGIKGRDPITLNLVAVPDDPPDVKVRLVGTREPVVTTKGRLPATGKITDDHGLGRAWWDYGRAAGRRR